jgi:hypothetical protein
VSVAYLKIDDNAPHHKKFLKAGPPASWLWLCGVAYAQRHQTDGFIPEIALETLGVKEHAELVPRLLEVRLWDRAEDGYQVHDFIGPYNDSAEVRRRKIQERNNRIARHRDEKRRGRATKQKHDTRENGNALPSEVGNAPPTPTPTPTPSPSPTPTPAPQPVAAAAVPIGPRSYDRQHQNHVFGFCDWVCLPAFLLSEFVNKGGRDEGAVLTWAKGIRAAWQGRHIGDNLEFWRARWHETASKSGTRSASDELEAEHNRVLAETRARHESIRKPR